MNIHAKPQLTQAETALVDGFAGLCASLPGDRAVAAKRAEAVERLKCGLPTRRVEAWHYTDLRRLLSVVPAQMPAAKAKSVTPLLDGSAVLPVFNGSAGTAASLDGVAATRLREKLIGGSLAPALGARDADDAIGAINTAYLSDGWFLDIAPNASLTPAIELQNLQAGGQAHVRFAARIGDGARATIVERHAGSGDALVSSVVNLVVGDRADVTWLILQQQPVGATHLGQFNAWIGKDASLTLCLLNSGGKLVRQEIRVSAKGDGGRFRLRGANLLTGDTHCDVAVVLEHESPHATSTQIVRNVVMQQASGAFQGRINVHQAAQKTDARMACNTLLLSPEAEFSAKPELEIYADDVLCGHGATIADILPEHLFYLRARGIPERQARAMLVHGFVEDTFSDIEDETLRDALIGQIENWLDRNG